MKTLYLECNMGAAGDMLAGALLELHPAERPGAAWGGVSGGTLGKMRCARHPCPRYGPRRGGAQPRCASGPRL